MILTRSCQAGEISGNHQIKSDQWSFHDMFYMLYLAIDVSVHIEWSLMLQTRHTVALWRCG
jgi:hypothetical protein